MTELDRRSFLIGTGAAALGSVTGPSGEAFQGTPRPPQLEPFEWNTPEVTFSFSFLGDKIRELYVRPRGEPSPTRSFKLSETAGLITSIHCTGEDCADHHGTKFTGGMPGCRLIFVSKEETSTAGGKRFVITQHDPGLGLQVESVYETFEHTPAVRRYTQVTNRGSRPVGIEYVSSAMLHNMAAPEHFDRELLVHFAYNSWQAEGQWHALPPSQVGFVDNGNFCLSAFTASSLGTWSTEKYLTAGLLENKERGLTWLWQIDHNGSWHCELSNHSDKSLYLYLGGPDEQYGHAWKNLMPGAAYQTVPVAIGCVRGGFVQGVEALTTYRRQIRRHFVPGVSCPVIFNDYMNCLEGNPTTAKELPLIEAAAEAGCEYFVIDAGWYAELNESWWSAVGMWQPSRTRWPGGGLQTVLNRIREKQMIPGLWLEPEVIGINSPLASKPDSWFFMRHGKRVIDHERYLLDFRNPEVRAYLDTVTERLVKGYGVGYIKMDHNVDGLLGTETEADSFGQGLLEHCRAVLRWLDDTLARYPDLMVENCASGGGRMDYAMLSRLHLQSSSDQTDYKKYPSIMTGASAGVLPEQLAAWSYPLADADPDQASFNMVSAMLCRIHQSGHLARLRPDSMAQIKRGIALYKESIREHVPHSTPFYPLGVPSINDGNSPVALGMKSPSATFAAVWRLGGNATVRMPDMGGNFELLYPRDLGIDKKQDGRDVVVEFPRPYMACILRRT